MNRKKLLHFTHWNALSHPLQAFEDELSKYYYVDRFAYMNMYEEFGRIEFQCNAMNKTDDYDIIIFSMDYGFEFDFNFFRKLKTLRPNLKIVILNADEALRFQTYNARLYDGADLILSSDSGISRSMHRILGRRAMVFRIYGSKDIFRPLPLERDIDVSFVGAAFGDRLAFIERLRREGIRIETYGTTFGNYLSVDDLVKIFNRSKINIDFSKIRRAESKTPCVEEACVKGRTFEVLSCKSFVLSQYAEDGEEIFKVGEEVEYFFDEDDLVEKVKYYLEHPEEREAIAARGYRRVTEYYDMSEQVKNLEWRLRSIDLQKNICTKEFSARFSYKNCMNYQYYTDWHLNKAIVFLSKFQILKFLQEIPCLIYALPSRKIVLSMLKSIQHKIHRNYLRAN